MLAEAKAKLAEYDGLLFRLQKKNAMKKRTRDSKNSVFNFVTPSLIGSDTNWISRTNDLVVLEDEAEQSWFFQNIMYWVKSYFPKLCAASINAFRQGIPHNDRNLLTLRST